MNSQELNPSDFVAEEHVQLRNVIWEYYSEDLIAAQNDEVLIYSSHSMSQNSAIASVGEGKEVLPLEFAQLSMCSTGTDDKDKELSEQTFSAEPQQNSPMRSLDSDDGSTSPELNDLLDFVIDSEPNMEKRPSLDACRDTSEKKRKDENENLLQSSSMMLVAQPAKTLNYRTLVNRKKSRVTDMCGTSQNRWPESNYVNFKRYPIPCLPPSMINHRSPTIDFNTDIIQFRPIGLNNRFLQPPIPTDNLRMNQIHPISTIPNLIPDTPKKDIRSSNVVCQYFSRKNPSFNLNNVETISSCVIVSNRLTSPFGPRPIFPPASLRNKSQNVVSTTSCSPFKHSEHILPEVTVHTTSPNHTYQPSMISSAPANGPQNVVNTTSGSSFKLSGHILPEVTVHKTSPNHTHQQSIISSAPSNGSKNVVSTTSGSSFKHSGHILPEVTVHKTSPNHTHQQSIISSAPSNGPKNVVNTTSGSPFKHSGHILPEVTVHKTSPNHTYQQSIISSAPSKIPQNVVSTMYSSPFNRHSEHILPEVTVHKASPNPTYQQSIISSAPSKIPQNVVSTMYSSPFNRHSEHILPEVTVHITSPNPTYQQSIISLPPSNRPQNVANTIFNPAFKRSYLTLPNVISHTGPLHSSHPQNMIPSTQENMHHGVVNTITSLPQKQSEQTDVSLQTAPLHHQIGTNVLQLDGQQPPPLARQMVPFKSTTKKSSKVQKVSCRENGRFNKRRCGMTKPSKKRATKKAAGKKPATRAKTQPLKVQPLRMAQGQQPHVPTPINALSQPPQVPMFPQVQPMSMAPAQHLEELIAVRENVQKNLKQFLCADSNCDDTTCFIARKYQNHALTCKHWYVANRCYLCWYISGTMDHAGKCEDFTCGSIFCKSKQEHTILESFSDPDFVRGFLRRLNVSEEEINETHVIKNRNNLSS